jgi:hydroxyethylthiazole kinase-like uncharacterized protein yjeF
MLAVYKSLDDHDLAATSRYGISTEILMENAARGVYEFLKENSLIGKKTLIVTGGGNNGADGLALARMIPNVAVFAAMEPKSELCKAQFERAKKLDVAFVDRCEGYEVIVDTILGSGATKELGGELKELVEHLNSQKAIKVAVDIPSGVRYKMQKDDTAFAADFTVTLGAYKESLYGDYAKEFVGGVLLKELGLPAQKYTQGFAHSSYLLEKSDLKTPIRNKKNCNKGDFGHLCIVGGEMIGASVIAAKTALRLGVGLVSVTARDNLLLEPQIMVSNSMPKGANTLLIGQGLGNAFDESEILGLVRTAKNCVCDADIFKKECLKDILEIEQDTVLTPHPKEFCSLLKIVMDIDVSIEELQQDRFGFAALFCEKYKNKTLVLKGANTLIAKNGEIFIMPYGSQVLAKGGSGDALAGAIAALLAQGYAPLEAAKNGSLAIALSAAGYEGANYSMNIDDLIDGLKWL